MRDHHATHLTTDTATIPGCDPTGSTSPRRPITAEERDRPGSQGRRGQEPPDTPLERRTIMTLAPEHEAMVLGVVDRPLTAVRPVEPPPARVARLRPTTPPGVFVLVAVLVLIVAALTALALHSVMVLR